MVSEPAPRIERTAPVVRRLSAGSAEDGAGLHLDFTRTPVFKSMLELFGPDTFRTRFPRDAGEDAVVTFVVENGRVTRLRLKALSPNADVSFDFHEPQSGAGGMTGSPRATSAFHPRQTFRSSAHRALP